MNSAENVGSNSAYMQNLKIILMLTNVGVTSNSKLSYIAFHAVKK